MKFYNAYINQYLKLFNKAAGGELYQQLPHRGKRYRYNKLVAE
ncbi:hypothetical protein [Symbiopectobacterium purcellii]